LDIVVAILINLFHIINSYVIHFKISPKASQFIEIANAISLKILISL